MFHDRDLAEEVAGPEVREVLAVLRDGDRLRCEIEGIGVLEISVADELPRAVNHATAAGVAELMELAR